MKMSLIFAESVPVSETHFNMNGSPEHSFWHSDTTQLENGVLHIVEV